MSDFLLLPVSPSSPFIPSINDNDCTTTSEIMVFNGRRRRLGPTKQRAHFWGQFFLHYRTRTGPISGQTATLRPPEPLFGTPDRGRDTFGRDFPTRNSLHGGANENRDRQLWLVAGFSSSPCLVYPVWPSPFVSFGWIPCCLHCALARGTHSPVYLTYICCVDAETTRRRVASTVWWSFRATREIFEPKWHSERVPCEWIDSRLKSEIV